MAENNEDITENIEEKKEKDPNNKITGWDVLDTPQLLRKVPIGPKLEDLQKSKVDQILFNKERPASHTLKDTLSFILGNALQEGAGAAVGAGINKVKGAKAISAYTDDILKNSLESAKKSKIVKGHENTLSREGKEIIQNAVDADVKALSASAAASDDSFENMKKILKSRIDFYTDSIVRDKANLDSMPERIKEAIRNFDNAKNPKELEKAYSAWEGLLSGEEHTKDSIGTFSKYIADSTDELNNLPKHFDELKKKANVATDNLERARNMLNDLIEGMSIDDINKKYGRQTSRLIDHPYNKGAKTAVTSYKLDPNDEELIKATKDYLNSKEGQELLSSFSHKKSDVLEKFLIKKAAEGDPIAIKLGEIAEEHGENFPWEDLFINDKDWLKELRDFEISDYDNFMEDFAKKSKMDTEGFKAKTDKEAASKLSDPSLGYMKNPVLGTKFDPKAASKKILKDAQNHKKYLDTFNKLLNPSDPLYKQLEDSTAKGKKLFLSDRIDKGQTVAEAIQDIALQRVINYYDKDYINYLNDLYKNPYMTSLKVAPKSIFINADGSLKNTDDILEFLTKDDIYKDTINSFIKDLTGNANTFAKAGALKGAAAPLLARYAERAIKTGVKNNYDPFGKDPGVELPPNMKPWDPSTEMSTSEKLWDNTKNFFGMNFDMDPSRYSRKQLDDMRQAILNANEKVGKWNPEQIEGWSDREVLRLIIEAGKGTRSDIDNEIKKEYLKLIEE